MKLSLAVLACLLSFSPRLVAQQQQTDSDVIGDMIDHPGHEEEIAQAAKERAARQKMLLETAYASNRDAVHLSHAVVAAQARLQPQSQKPCITPPYSSMPDNLAEQKFFESGFTGPDGGSPQVSSLDFSQINPKPTHTLDLTVMVQAGSGWSMKEVADTLARTAKIYGTCGLQIHRVTIAYADFPTGRGPLSKKNEKELTNAMPQRPKPWLFFGDLTGNADALEGGGSFAYYKHMNVGTLTHSAWFGRQSLVTADGKLTAYGRSPELVVGHELAHVLTNGDHQSEVPNLLNGNGKDLAPSLTAHECEQMRANADLVHPVLRQK